MENNKTNFPSPESGFSFLCDIVQNNKKWSVFIKAPKNEKLIAKIKACKTSSPSRFREKRNFWLNYNFPLCRFSRSSELQAALNLIGFDGLKEIEKELVKMDGSSK